MELPFSMFVMFCLLMQKEGSQSLFRVRSHEIIFSVKFAASEQVEECE